jgi:hypothetical protein
MDERSVMKTLRYNVEVNLFTLKESIERLLLIICDHEKEIERLNRELNKLRAKNGE